MKEVSLVCGIRSSNESGSSRKSESMDPFVQADIVTEISFFFGYQYSMEGFDFMF